MTPAPVPQHAVFGDLSAAAARHRPLLGRARQRAQSELGIAALLAALLVAGLWRIDFGLARMLVGLAKFVAIL
jgi:hypothetical protein